MSSLKTYYQKGRILLLEKRMLSTRILIGVVIFLLLFTAPGIRENTTLELIFDWIGYFLVIASCLGRIFSSLFISGTKNEVLSTKGPFSLVRNPLYVFSFLGVVGAGFLSTRLILLFLLIAIFFVYYPQVVEGEEEFLKGKFGEEYEGYKTRVSRWYPKQWHMDLPETITVYPQLVLHTIRDSSLFFLVFPVMETIGTWHASGVLPSLFTLF